MDESDFSEENEDRDEGPEEVLDPDNPEHAYAILERDFNKTITEMEANPEASQFADEYTKLYDSLIKTNDAKRELEDFNAVMHKEILEKDEKLENYSKLTTVDLKTINELKEQINHAWRMADAAHSREQDAQEIIDNLRRQVESLIAELNFKHKMQESDEAAVESSKNKDELQRQREKLVNEVSQLQTKLANALGYQDELEKKNSQADLKINEINGQLEDQIVEVERQKKSREKVESDISTLRLKIEDRDAQINDLASIINVHAKQIIRLENDIKDQKGNFEKVSRELEVTGMKQGKLQEEYNSAVKELEENNVKLNQKLTELRDSEITNSHLRNDISKLMKTKDGIEKKLYATNSERDELVEDRNKLRQRIAIFEKEIDDFKKALDTDKRSLDNVTKEKEVLNKTIIKQQAVTKEQQKLIKIQENSKSKLENELDNFFAEINRHLKTITGLERERDRLDEEQINFKKRIEDGMEEIRQKKTTIFDLKKSMTEQENKLRQQQNLFEAIRTDRNALQKSLQESSSESAELKSKLKIVLHQTEQLKEDIFMKEKLLIKEENIMRKMVKEKENLKTEVNTGLDTIKSLKSEIKEMKEEEKRLHESLLENERVIRDQTKNLEQLMNERDVLGSQLVRRNDEISLLNEKIKILQTTLSRGESQYDQRLGDIKLLKIEVKRLRQEKNILTKSMNNMVDYRQEIFRLERDLTKYRLKCRALEEEVQNPLNIHRWRKLEGSDPEVLDLIQKIQILQKRLLQQASEAIDRERQLKEAERLYLNLRQVVSKQPGPTAQGQLLKTQKALKVRGDKLKVLVTELNMSELKATEYKSDLQRVTDELAELKKKYLEEKKANRSRRLAYESSRELNQSRSEGAEVKFTGGGFRMSVQQISSK